MNTGESGSYEALPLEEWNADMQAAVGDIRRIGLEVLKEHGAAGEKALEVSKQWKLAERQADEHEALLRLIEASRLMVEKIDGAMRSMAPDVMETAARTIEQNLADIEESFLVIRHASLDLLRWTRRAGRIEGSPLPGEYRASYARLISYAPIFKPRLEAFQHELLELSRQPGAESAAPRLLSAITRYNAVLDSARRFVQAIVDPPLELVFQETNLFLDDWQNCSVGDRSAMASRLNDCCQLLLYDKTEFDRRTEKVRPRLADGIDASMYSMAIDKGRILFSVDEDPVFEQLTVTLYRLVDEEKFADACEVVFQVLYTDFDPR
ncbi:MAG: hypothetical protein ABFS19_08635 [Thermodesulfobacteriota bacterium]